MVLSSFSLAVYADDGPPPGMINIPDSSPWKGSVFGDVGGQDKITAENFEITEHEDGSVTVRSSKDRGKIASTSEGIAYYYQDVSYLDNYELKAKAHVESWTAHNQVAFGIMIRESILENQHASFVSDYVAVGALDQTMKGFYKENRGSLVKSGYEFNANKPAAGETYELTLRKYGNVYSIRIGDESYEIVSDSKLSYAGLFTSRNTTVTFTDVELHMLPSHLYTTEYEFRYFGGNTSESKNPTPYVESGEGLTMKASGGKIASGDEGISFYYVAMDANANFEISADVKVKSFNGDSSISTPNQKSFGIMVRDEVGNHGDTSTQTSNYVAVGALDQVMKAFYKKGSQQKLDTYTANPPKADETYHLSLRKNGDVYVLSVDGEEQTIVLRDIFTYDDIYVGFYAARDAEITLSNGRFIEDLRKVNTLTVDASQMKTLYLVGESLDLTGLKVSAQTEDPEGNIREEVLNSSEYIVTGFNSDVQGTNTITIHFHGQTDKRDLDIVAASVIHMEIEYYPAKTVYYPGDTFDPEGLTVYAEYNSLISKYLTPDLYTFDIPDAQKTLDGYVFDNPGTYTVRVVSTETPDQYDEFQVSVKNAELKSIEITQLPAKSQYFLGNDLDLSGLVVYARYSDGESVRLMKQDYTVSGFDSTTEGDQTVTLTYKGKTASFDINVKEREVSHLEVTEYPRTTYTVGGTFDPAGLVVSKVYDNGDRELYEDYNIDTSAWDSSQPGVTEIRIVPDDASLSAITLPITIREAKLYDWQWIRFGQSTSTANNKATILEDGSIKLEALGGSAGKVTGDHDGITYYYTVIDGHEDNFVLSADIQVIDYAKDPHDGQESFGIMARDAIGMHGDASVFASNIAAVGGYSGGTRNDNGTQLFVRTGVESPDGSGSQGIQRIMLKNERPGPSNTHPNAPYRLTLAKTNSGYVGKLNNDKEEILFEPDILTVQDDKIYVGFYVARQATIVVSNIEFEVTAAETDARRVAPPAQAIEPAVDILSLDRTSETDYIFRARSNADGTYTLKLGQTVIAQDVPGQAGKIVEIPAALSAGNNLFSLTFIPDDTQYLTHYDRIISNFKVEVRTYQAGSDIYVSPTGTPSGDGSPEKPLDLDTAIDFVLPGQKIIVQDGRYVRNSSLVIKKYNDGREGEMKMLFAADGASPVIDFDKKSEGVVHSGNYWHVKGLSFTRSADNYKGYTLGGNHNIIELNKFYANGDTGFQISRTDSTANSIEEWPSYNLVLNNESYDNVDPSHNNADGFAAKLTSGVGNVFRGNVAHHNIDDGWDLYTKAGQGAIGAILLEGNITYQNGTLTDGTVGNGDKNGFKLGGEGIHVPHIVRNNIAFENGAAGFTSNSNPGITLENNISFNNGGANLNLTTYTNIQEDFQLTGFISYRTQGTASDNVPDRLKTDENFLFDGTKSVNALGHVLTADNFASLEPEVLPFERDAAGDLILGDFLRFIDTFPPDEVSDVSVISGHGKLTITWTDPVDEDLSKIYITGEGDTVVGAVYVDAGVGNHTFTGLENGVTYEFRISTIDQSGNMSKGVVISGMPEADTIPPGEVSNLSVISGHGKLTITWTDPTDEDLSKIYITGEDFTVIDAVYVDKGVGSYTFTGLENGVTYDFRISTIDEYGNMSSGVTISGTPEADTTPPGEVRDAKVTAGVLQLKITWTDPDDEDLDKIYISGAGKTVVEAVYVDAGVGSYTYTGLNPDVTYEFRISTIDKYGNESVGVTVSGTPQAADPGEEPEEPGEEPEDTTPPAEVSNASVTSGNGQLTITWTDPSDEDLSKIYISGAGTTVIEAVYVDKGVQQYRLTGLTNGTTYQLRIQTIDTSGNVSAGVTVSGTPQAPQSGGPVIVTPPPAPPQPEITTGEDGAAEIVPVVEADGDSISTTISEDVFQQALENAAADESGKKTVVIKLEPEAKQVQVELPVQAVSSSDNHQVVISSSLGNLILPSNMLSNLELGEGDTVQLVLAEAQTADNSDRKVIEIHVKVNDEIIGWNNAAASVTVEIPYEPTASESQQHEFLSVVYIDDQGNRTPIYNGRYDPAKGSVIFTTNHFSQYAVVFAPKSFSDIAAYPWAKHAIEVLATKGIINGTSVERNTFTPAANISRADFILLLVKTLGLQAEVTDNFSDVRVGDYFYEAVGIAKALGITNGDGKGNFNPRAEITRQDMFTLTARALAVVGYEFEAASDAVLDPFSDRDAIASYAQAQIAALVAEGLVNGSGGKMNPKANAMRAEAATFLYRIYNLD